MFADLLATVPPTDPTTTTTSIVETTTTTVAPIIYEFGTQETWFIGHPLIAGGFCAMIVVLVRYLVPERV